MFEEVMENYKRMATSDKREMLISELKLMVAIFEKMCEDNSIEYRKIQSNEILDLNSGKETEDDYLEAAFVYVEYLKEVLGSLFDRIQNG
jgi:hypothetical protein